MFWPAEVAEVIRSSHHWWTPKHQMVDTKHIPSKRSHQLVTLLGATIDMVEWREKYQTVDTKWWNTGHGHQMVKQGTPKHQTLDAFQGEALTKHQLVTLSFCHSKNAFFRILLPFKFPFLHSQLPGYLHKECPRFGLFFAVYYHKECPHCLDLLELQLKPGKGPN